tara:strand:- start:159 stop:554 length:396 start_codon:yes stop_codon:yes gene_type:complete
MSVAHDLLSFVTFRGLEEDAPKTNIFSVEDVFHDSKTVPQFCWFHASYCGHCHSVYGEWSKLILKCEGKKISLKSLECSQKQALLAKFKDRGIVVTGYPTWVLINKGKLVPYEEGRSAEDFYAWFEKMNVI